MWKKIKNTMWDRMPKWGRWIFYPIFIFMTVMVILALTVL